jgi:hypothetical protein
MLPMMWRPSVHDGSLDAAPLRPQPQPAGFEAQALASRIWAIEFWERAAQLPGLSPVLQEASSVNAKWLKAQGAE